MIMNYHDRSDLVQYVTINRKDNNMSDHISAVYADKILKYHDQSDLVSTMMKTR